MRIDIGSFTDEELQAEITRRAENRIVSLSPLLEPAWDELYDFIVERVEDACKNGHFDKDINQYVYEQTMTTIYGDNFFNWFKERFDK